MRAHAIEPLHVVALRDWLRVGLKVSFRAHRPTHGYGHKQSMTTKKCSHSTFDMNDVLLAAPSKRPFNRMVSSFCVPAASHSVVLATKPDTQRGAVIETRNANLELSSMVAVMVVVNSFSDQFQLGRIDAKCAKNDLRVKFF